MLISGAVEALSAYRGHPDSYAMESLHASETCRHLQACQSIMKLVNLGSDSWLVKKNLVAHIWDIRSLRHIGMAGAGGESV